MSRQWFKEIGFQNQQTFDYSVCVPQNDITSRKGLIICSCYSATVFMRERFYSLIFFNSLWRDRLLESDICWDDYTKESAAIYLNLSSLKQTVFSVSFAFLITAEETSHQKKSTRLLWRSNREKQIFFQLWPQNPPKKKQQEGRSMQVSLQPFRI